MPSFGEWGYIIGGRRAFVPTESFSVATRFINPQTQKLMFDFPPDMGRVPAEVNRLNNQSLVRTFEDEWRHVVR